MISNVKSVLIALTKVSGEDEVPSAVSYGLSLASRRGLMPQLRRSLSGWRSQALRSATS
jgi:hypothetical protein